MSGYPHKLADIGERQLRIIDRDPDSSTGPSQDRPNLCRCDLSHEPFLQDSPSRRACVDGPVTDLQRNAGSSDIQVLRTRVTCERGGVAKGYLPGKPESQPRPHAFGRRKLCPPPGRRPFACAGNAIARTTISATARLPILEGSRAPLKLVSAAQAASMPQPAPCETLDEKALITTTPATIKPIPTIAATSRDWARNAQPIRAMSAVPAPAHTA